jgi:hypothetical protein
VPTAIPIRYVHDVIASARESGRTATVVSTCSARAVNAYLVRADLSNLAVARTSYSPESVSVPHLISRATVLLTPARHGRRRVRACHDVSGRAHGSGRDQCRSHRVRHHPDRRRLASREEPGRPS